jgi:hypothetical protein
MLLPVVINWTPRSKAAWGAAEGNVVLLTAGVATYAIQYGLLLSSRRLFQFHPAKVLLFPLVIVPVICCMTRALCLHFFQGSVHWRGRTIRVRPSA